MYCSEMSWSARPSEACGDMAADMLDAMMLDPILQLLEEPVDPAMAPEGARSPTSRKNTTGGFRPFPASGGPRRALWPSIILPRAVLTRKFQHTNMYAPEVGVDVWS